MDLQGPAAFEALAKEAVHCRDCFRDGRVLAPRVDLAQPRWIGPSYWASRPRVLIVALNPGGGAARHDAGNRVFVDRLRAFAGGTGTLRAVLDHQADDMPNWGRVQGRYTDFYFRGLCLAQDATAMANIAWCATAGDKYPGWMLRNCMARHTSRLIALLEPDIVLLSGSNTHHFRPVIEQLRPAASVVTMLHYAHRESPQREAEDLARVRKTISAWRAPTT
jgi:hypothetical protein